MHPAIELLLKRMESNPDEFMDGHRRNNRWGRIMDKYDSFMSEDDRKVLKEKYTALQMDSMHKEIMAELLYGEEERQKELEFEQMSLARRLGISAAQQPMITPGTIVNVQHQGSITAPANITPGNLNVDSITIAGTKLDKSLIQKIKDFTK